MLLLPAKVRQAGEAAFEEALAAGRRFEAARLALRADVLAAWAGLWLLDERLAEEEQDLSLQSSLARQSRAAVGTGASQAELLALQLELERARTALTTLAAEVAGRRAALNALLVREPDAALVLPDAAELRRPDDATIRSRRGRSRVASGERRHSPARGPIARPAAQHGTITPATAAPAVRAAGRRRRGPTQHSARARGGAAPLATPSCRTARTSSWPLRQRSTRARAVADNQSASSTAGGLPS
jgi:hypothetical protein